MKCLAVKKDGAPCSIDAGRRGLCHVHDPDAAYAMQHPAARLALFKRADIRRALGSDVDEPSLFDDTDPPS